MRAIPPYWETWFALFHRRLTTPATEEGRAWLMARSPITRADQIVRPLLIIQGMNDVRVKPQESEQVVKVLQQRGIPVTYVTFGDEGHGFVREENRLAYRRDGCFWPVTSVATSSPLGTHSQVRRSDLKRDRS